MAARDVPVASTMLAGRASDALHANAPSRPSAAVVAEAHALVSTAAASLPAADMSKPKATRRASQPWSAEEDMALLKAVGELGPKRWSAVSLCVGTRSGKQCRLRWYAPFPPCRVILTGHDTLLSNKTGVRLRRASTDGVPLYAPHTLPGAIRSIQASVETLGVSMRTQSSFTPAHSKFPCPGWKLPSFCPVARITRSKTVGTAHCSARRSEVCPRHLVLAVVAQHPPPLWRPRSFRRSP